MITRTSKTVLKKLSENKEYAKGYKKATRSLAEVFLALANGMEFGKTTYTNDQGRIIQNIKDFATDIITRKLG